MPLELIINQQLREEVIKMTEAQARHIWEVLLDVSGRKDVIVEVRPATVVGEERREAAA